MHCVGAGLIYKDFKVGEGNTPVDGQEVTFDYTAYNESAGFIDSTYRKGNAASSQLGASGLIPGATRNCTLCSRPSSAWCVHSWCACAACCSVFERHA